MDDGGPCPGLSPEVAARFAAAEAAADGDTWEVAPHKETPTKSLGAKNLLALFDEPGKAAAEPEPAIPLEFQGEDLKAEQPAPAGGVVGLAILMTQMRLVPHSILSTKR